MDGINALLQARADARASMTALLDTAQAENGRALTEEEDSDYVRLEASLSATQRDIGRRQLLQEGERTAPAVAVLDRGEVAEAQVPTFDDLGTHLLAISQAEITHGRGMDPRLVAISGASEGVGADGGFLLDSGETGELMRTVHETGVLVSKCQQRPITNNTNRIKIRAFDETSRANGSRMGGVQAYWDGEGDSSTGSKPTFRVLELEARKLTGLYYATEELLQDAPALAADVRAWFAEEFGFKLDDAIINGKGGNQPTGILKSGGPLVTIDKETAQPASTLVAANVEKMFARMWAKSWPRSEWFINQNVWPQIFQLAHVIGTAGIPMYMRAGGLQNSPFGELLGRPITPIEQCSSLGTLGDIILGDLHEYILAQKGGLQAATSIHIKFIEGETAFRFIIRVDGKPRWRKVLIPFKGGASNSVSPFVTLAARA